MNDTSRRLIGYGLGGAVLAGLLGGVLHFRETDADPMTLLGSVEVHLRLAASFPRTGPDGEPNPQHAQLVQQARGFLVRARRQEPELFLGMEYEAWSLGLAGDYPAAAAMYRSAQTGQGATTESRQADLLNEARMWRAAAEPRRAIKALARPSAGFSSANATAAQVETMLAHEALSDADAATQVAVRIANDSEDPMALLDAGHCLYRAGRWDDAERAYGKAVERKPLANYFLARLKVRARDFDTGMSLLNRAVAVDERAVRSMLKRDADLWQPLHNDSRFKSLLSPVTAAAKPGR